jgi:hypothetical protein
MKLLIMQYFPASIHCPPLRSRYSPRHSVLTHNLWSSLSMKDQFSHHIKQKCFIFPRKFLSFETHVRLGPFPLNYTLTRLFRNKTCYCNYISQLWNSN